MNSTDETIKQLTTIAANHKLDATDNKIMAALIDAMTLGMQESRKIFTGSKQHEAIR